MAAFSNSFEALQLPCNSFVPVVFVGAGEMRHKRNARDGMNGLSVSIAAGNCSGVTRAGSCPC